LFALITLAKIVFKDHEKLAVLNNIIHPLVENDFLAWCKLNHNQAYILHEAAILFESGFYKMMDFTILVSASEEMRVDRVKMRDNISREQVLARMAKQWPDSEKRKLATFELVNDNKNLLIPQIIEIDKKLKTDGKIW